MDIVDKITLSLKEHRQSSSTQRAKASQEEIVFQGTYYYVDADLEYTVSDDSDTRSHSYGPRKTLVVDKVEITKVDKARENEEQTLPVDLNDPVLDILSDMLKEKLENDPDFAP